MSIHTAIGFAKQAISVGDLAARHTRRRGLLEKLRSVKGEKARGIARKAMGRAEQDQLRAGESALSYNQWTKKVDPSTKALPKGERDAGEVSAKIDAANR